MSFMEAIQYLANKYHVTLHDQAVEETDEQRRKRLYRESVQNQYEIVQKFYEENIRNADKEAVAAYQYAKDRWSDDFVANEGKYSRNSICSPRAKTDESTISSVAGS